MLCAPISADAADLLKVRKEKALLQTTLDETRSKQKRDMETVKEGHKKANSELDAARRSHEVELKKAKAVCDAREEELKQLRMELVKANQVKTKLDWSLDDVLCNAKTYR
jgi:hypothetical protein